MGFAALLKAGMDVVFPSWCVGCHRPGHQLCPGCVGRLRAEPYQASPVRAPDGFPRCVASAAYRGPLRAALLAYKEHGRHVLLRPLAQVLAAGLAVTVATQERRPLLLVAIPCSRAAHRARGRDHLAPLLAEACRVARVQRSVRRVRALRSPRRRLDSVGLTATERQKNAQHAFVVRPRARDSLSGADVLIVDDVVASGATLAEASRVLRTAGAKVVGALVLAGA